MSVTKHSVNGKDLRGGNVLQIPLYYINEILKSIMSAVFKTQMQHSPTASPKQSFECTAMNVVTLSLI